MQKRGYCSHPQKKSRIVTEWKCVDIQYPATISPEERARRSVVCREKDHYGVCEFCKWFTPDAEQPETIKSAAAGVPAKPAEKPVYTETNSNNFDKLWLEDLM